MKFFRCKTYTAIIKVLMNHLNDQKIMNYQHIIDYAVGL